MPARNQAGFNFVELILGLGVLALAMLVLVSVLAVLPRLEDSRTADAHLRQARSCAETIIAAHAESGSGLRFQGCDGGTANFANWVANFTVSDPDGLGALQAHCPSDALTVSCSWQGDHAEIGIASAQGAALPLHLQLIPKPGSTP